MSGGVFPFSLFIIFQVALILFLDLRITLLMCDFLALLITLDNIVQYFL